jgi:hypothetical protein
MSIENFDSNRKYIWDYFHLHASQRLTTFNFYLVLSTLLSTGLFSTFQKDFTIVPVGIVLGLMLFILSFVFWKLDERNKGLIKHAEAALKYLEEQNQIGTVGQQTEILSIFTREDIETNRLRAINSIMPWRNLYSYSDCFRFIFILFSIIGLLGGCFSVYRLLHDSFIGPHGSNSRMILSVDENLYVTVPHCQSNVPSAGSIHFHRCEGHIPFHS